MDGVPVIAGLFSKLLMQGIVVQERGVSGFFASLGHASWGALAWPLRCISDEGGMRLWSFDVGHGGVQWLHVTSHSAWVAFPYKAVRMLDGLHVRQTALEEPLLKHVLRKKHDLDFHDLVRLASHYDLGGVDGHSRREELLRALALHIGGGDEDFLQLVLSADQHREEPAAKLLVEDPLFDKLYEEMDPDDQKEFAEVGEARHRGKIRKHFEFCKHRQASGKAKARAKRRQARQAHQQGAAGPVVPLAAVPPAAVEVPPAVVPPAVPVQVPPPPLGPNLDGHDDQQLQRRRREEVFDAALRASNRGEPFGEHWILAEVYSRGVLTSWSCRCFLHTVDGVHCNKTLVMGTQFTPDEAKHRIMEWCIRGLRFPDTPGSRDRHMVEEKPRTYGVNELRPMPELLRLAANAAPN